MMLPAATGNLASRFLEPLSHPWTVFTGGLLTAGILGEDMPGVVVRVAWRLLRLLLAL
jgi:hypothetical protein